MKTQTTETTTFVLPRSGARVARRAAMIVALCALVATLTATWLSSSPAEAGKGKPAPAAKAGKADAPAPAPVVTAIDDDGIEIDGDAPKKSTKRGKAKGELTGKLNLNTATVEQLTLLPGVGPSKAERVIEWRGKNGGFKRVADLRKVKGFGYKTLKKLEPYLDIKGDTTLAAK
jgi:competence protein ComEA